MKIKFLSGVIWTNGDNEAGQIKDLPDDDAKALIARGYAEEVKAKDGK